MSESEPVKPAKVRTGGCLCGAVKYKLEGEAAAASWTAICHCLNCRRWSGSALYTASICPPNGFTITEGEDKLTTYHDTMTDSGKPLKRMFCSICGSGMFNFSPLFDSVSISAGSHDDFEDWEPTMEQYCIHRAKWVEKARGVPSERRYKELFESETEKD